MEEHNWKVVNTNTGEIVSEDPSYFESVRLICEYLPYRDMGLSRAQINAMDSFADTIEHSYISEFDFHYPSRTKPSVKFNVHIETSWTLHRKDARAVVTIKYNGETSKQMFKLLEEELTPDLSRMRIARHIYTVILLNSGAPFPPSEEESRHLKEEIRRQKLQQSHEPIEFGGDLGLEERLKVRNFLPKTKTWQRVRSFWRKRPSTVEAVQVDLDTRVINLEWWVKTSNPLSRLAKPKSSTFIPVSDLQGGFKVRTTRGELFARPGAWIVLEITGELSVWEDDAFCQSFEEICEK